MRKNDHENENLYLTLSEIKEEYPKAARIYNWSSKMFFYYHEGGLLKRKFNNTINTYVYSVKHLKKLIRMINDNLDDAHIDLDD